MKAPPSLFNYTIIDRHGCGEYYILAFRRRFLYCRMDMIRLGLKAGPGDRYY